MENHHEKDNRIGFIQGDDIGNFSNLVTGKLENDSISQKQEKCVTKYAEEGGDDANTDFLFSVCSGFLCFDSRELRFGLHVAEAGIFERHGGLLQTIMRSVRARHRVHRTSYWWSLLRLLI